VKVDEMVVLGHTPERFSGSPSGRSKSYPINRTLHSFSRLPSFMPLSYIPTLGMLSAIIKSPYKILYNIIIMYRAMYNVTIILNKTFNSLLLRESELSRYFFSQNFEVILPAK